MNIGEDDLSNARRKIENHIFSTKILQIGFRMVQRISRLSKKDQNNRKLTHQRPGQARFLKGNKKWKNVVLEAELA